MTDERLEGRIGVDVNERRHRMNFADVSALARHLYETQGPKAIAEAVRKAESSRQAGDEAQERLWRRVETALREMRGPHQS